MAATDFRVSYETRDDMRAWLADDEEARSGSMIGPGIAVSMLEWSMLAPEPRVGALRFDWFPYLAANPKSSSGDGEEGLYGDRVADARNVVVAKATQCGVSAWAWRWAARRADQFADRCLYVFPTDRHVTEFGRERVDPAIQESDYLRTRTPPSFINNQHQKRIGDGWLYLRGTVQTRKDRRAVGAQSVAAQSIVFDEYDDLEPATVAQMERRLSGASQTGTMARVRRIGVPTTDDYGVALAYARSDQRRWHVTCPECHVEAVPVWENVRWRTRAAGEEVCRVGHDHFDDVEDVLEAWRICPKCEAPIDVADGRWIAERPDATSIGFHISRLIIPGVDLASLVQNSRGRKQYEIEAFHQNDLGEPYTSAESGLGRDVIEAAVSMGVETVPFYDGPMLVTAGLDVAGSRDLNVRISLQHEDGTRSPLHVGTVEDFDAAAALIDAYNVRMMAVDMAPETRSARGLAATFPGRVVLARYDDDVKQPIVINEADNLIAANRTDALDAMIAGVRSGRTRLPSTPPLGYVDHLASLRRQLQFDSKGRPTYRYISVGTAGDDFAHAEVYDLMAKEYCVALGLASVGEAEQVIAGGIETEHLAEDYEARHGWVR